MRGWPVATIALYGPNLSQATKVAVGIVPSETAEPREVRDWKVENGDVRADPAIAQEILDFIEGHSVLSVVMTDDIIGCPHQEGVDYEGECAKNGPPLAGHGAEAVRDAITRTIVTLPEELRRSLTWDQGAEMAQHARLKIDAGVQVYFCDPQSPWQRGTNENTNGLLRPRKAPI